MGQKVIVTRNAQGALGITMAIDRTDCVSGELYALLLTDGRTVVAMCMAEVDSDEGLKFADEEERQLDEVVTKIDTVQ